MADIIQWVNLDPNNANHGNIPGEGPIPPERRGSQITLKARVTGQRRARRRIWWGVQPGRDNLVPGTPGTTPAGWAWQAGQAGFGAPGFFERMVPTNRRGESIVRFDLSEFGGDRYTIKAFTKFPDGRVRRELESDTYIVWRQLFYQVTRMGPSAGRQNLPAIPDIPWNSVKSEYNDSRKPHNLRWSSVPPSAAIIRRHRCLLGDAAVLATGQEGYDRTYEPLVLKVSLIDILAERSQEDHDFDVVEARETYTYQSDNLLFDMNSADDKNDWFMSASAHRLGEPSQTIPITRNEFARAGDASITCTLQNIPKRHAVDWCRKATVSVSIYVFDRWKNGRSQYNGIWAIHTSIRWASGGNPPAFRTRADPDKVGTMIHEFGHAIGMVARGPGPDGNPHPKQYGQGGVRTYGHMGSHCWNGKAGLPASTGDPFPLTPDAICVMFGDDSRVNNVFCDICVPFVRSRRPSVDGKLTAGAMLPP
jgi:hypothetical protein